MTDRSCVICGGELTGRQAKYCREECSRAGARAAWILKTYGLTMEQFQAIWDFQGGACGVCRKPFKESAVPHIDHEHGGHVRGLVHSYCNTRLIGRLKSWELAQWLADYLRYPPAVLALGAAVVAPGRPGRKRRRKRTGK